MNYQFYAPSLRKLETVNNLSEHKANIRLYLLVTRCQAGDIKAFEQLYDEFSSRTHTHIKNVIGAVESEDVLQDLWVSVYLNIKDLMNPHGFKTWLFRITRNKAIDHLRLKNKLPKSYELELDEISEDAVTLEESDDFLNEINDSLLEAISVLPAPQKEVMLLKYWEGMTYEEIALIIGEKLGTVRSRIYYGKKAIRAKLNYEHINKHK